MSTLTPTMPVKRATMQPAAPRALESEQHSLARTVALHLLPGILNLVIFLLSFGFVKNLGFPEDFARALIVMPLGVILFQLGFLFYQGRIRSGRFTLADVVLFREHLSLWQYVALLVPLFLVTFAGYVVIYPLIGDALEATVLAWLPAWYLAEVNYAQYAPTVVLFMAAVSLTVYTLAGAVEELYFRGYLLPRISRFGWWAPVLNSALFALYHTDVVWTAPAVFIVFLPTALVTFWKKNVYLAMVLHAGGNLIAYLLIFLPILFK